CPLADRLSMCEEKRNTPSHSNDRQQKGGSVNGQTIVSTSQCENEPKPANRTWLREARRRRTSAVPAEPSIATINPDDYTQPDMRTPIKRTKHDDDTSVTESETVGFRAKKARLSELQTELTVKSGSYETTKKVRTRPKAKSIRRVDAFKSIKQSLLPDLWHPGLKHQNYSPSILLNTVQTRLEETRRQTVEFQRNLVELRKKFDYSCRQLNIPVHPNIHAEDDSATHTVLTDLKLWHLSSMFDQPFAPNWKTLSVICNISSPLGCESPVYEELIEQIDRLAGSDSRVSVYLVLLFWLERCSNPINSEKPPTLEYLLDQLRISGYEKFASFCVAHINDTKPW
ncbi:hypothetical protein FGIG_11570, partial [Fasciola gigantica]